MEMNNMKKMNPIIHNSPEYKEARKAFQGINATTKGSIEKSKRRHSVKSKVLQDKRDTAYTEQYKHKKTYPGDYESSPRE